MGNIFEQPEPDILTEYYDRGEGFWQKVKRYIQNFRRLLSGDSPLDYHERGEFDDMAEQDYFQERW